MKLSELDPSEVTVVPAKLVGLSGPGSKDDSPSDVITTPVPHGPKDIPSDLAGGAADSVKSMARGAMTIAKEASPVDENGLKVPFSGLNDSSKRRELERGVSDVVTGGVAQKLANKVSPELKASEESDAKNAPGYRDAGGVAGGFLPNPLGYAAGKAIEAGGAGVRSIATKLEPGATSRTTGRTINEMSKGAPRGLRVELGKAKGDLEGVLQSDPEIAAKPKDPDATIAAIDKALDDRSAELDRRYQSATDKYVSDPNAPTHVEDEPTSQLSKPNFTPSRRQITGTVQGENPILPPNDKALIDTKSAVPNEIPEETTARIEPSSKPRTESIESSTIEMRPNGSLLPHEVKASIISKANELERSSAPQSDAVVRIHGDLEREVAAEIRATHDDPSLRWWRQKATDLQKVGHGHSTTSIETANQAAHVEVANVIRDALEAHMQDPEVNRLNAEVSALMKLKKVQEAKILDKNAPGSSPGKYGSRLASMFKGTADAMAAVAVASGHPQAAIVPAAIHGGPMVASMADRMIAKIAGAAARGEDVSPLVTQALKSGISQSQIDDSLKHVKK